MGWTLDDIDWGAFDAQAVDAGLLALVKAAALVEANAEDYVAYLRGVFAEDPSFLNRLARWGAEEAQHGAALGLWAMHADPDWDFDAALARFRTGYRVATDATASIRGSRAGELLARQVVETGTSSFYTALRDAGHEPVLREIALRIAADEVAHYRLFARAAAALPPLPLFERLKVAATRFAEAGDDELGWAWFAANMPADAAYRSGVHSRAYAAQVLRVYRRPHVAGAVAMTLRALSLRPDGGLARWLSGLAWSALRVRRAVA